MKKILLSLCGMVGLVFGIGGGFCETCDPNSIIIEEGVIKVTYDETVDYTPVGKPRFEFITPKGQIQFAFDNPNTIGTFVGSIRNKSNGSIFFNLGKGGTLNIKGGGDWSDIPTGNSLVSDGGGQILISLENGGKLNIDGGIYAIGENSENIISVHQGSVGSVVNINGKLSVGSGGWNNITILDGELILDSVEHFGTSRTSQGTNLISSIGSNVTVNGNIHSNYGVEKPALSGNPGNHFMLRAGNHVFEGNITVDKTYGGGNRVFLYDDARVTFNGATVELSNFGGDHNGFNVTYKGNLTIGQIAGSFTGTFNRTGGGSENLLTIKRGLYLGKYTISPKTPVKEGEVLAYTDQGTTIVATDFDDGIITGPVKLEKVLEGNMLKWFVGGETKPEPEPTPPNPEPTPPDQGGGDTGGTNPTPPDQSGEGGDSNNGGDNKPPVVNPDPDPVPPTKPDVPGEPEEKPEEKPDKPTGPTISEQLRPRVEEIATTVYGIYFFNFNSLNKRMGELRDNPYRLGLWARVFGGNGSNDFNASTSDFVTIQAGYDYGFALKGGKNYLGLAGSYGFGEETLPTNKFKTELFDIGLYNSVVMDSGWYNDTIFKIGMIMNDLAKDVLTYTLSNEVGYRAKLGKSKRFFLDPQIEVALGYVSGSDYVVSNATSGVMVKHDPFTMIRTRLGMSMGFDFSNMIKKDLNGNIHVGAYGEIDNYFKSNPSVSGSGIHYDIKNKLSGNDYRGVLNYGINIEAIDGLNVYIDSEHSFGGKIKINWKINGGLRVSFGKKDVTEETKEKTEVTPIKLKEETETKEPEK